MLDWMRFLPSSEHRDNAPGLGARGEQEPDDPEFSNRHDPRVQTRQRILKFLERQTGQKHGEDLDEWRHWMWAQPYETHAQISTFNANLYGSVDQAFRKFFRGTSAVRIDEIDWAACG